MMRALIVSLSLLVQADDEAMRMLNDWIVSVDQHAAGQRDEALKRLAAWSADDLDMMRAYVEALTEVPVDSRERGARRRQLGGADVVAIKQRTMALQRRGNFDDFRKRAALLHTDTALLASLPTIVTAPTARAQKSRWRSDEAEPAVDVQHLDGRVERFEIANPHWQFAMDVLDALPAQPRRDPIVAQWYRTIGAYFARNHSFGDAIRHFERARKTAADDPGVLFGEACLQETLGSPTEQNFARVTTLPNGLVFVGMSSPQTHFRRAEVLLTRALAAQPNFVDARLRLGRVLAEQRQHDAALRHFAQVVTESRDPVLTYYAHLFAGDAALALDRPSDARESYQRALTAYPQAQSARLGLGAALRAAGDRQSALGAVMTTITMGPKTRDAVDDPWWQYYEGDAANVERLLRELRAPYLSVAR